MRCSPSASEPDGTHRIVRLDLNANGRAVTRVDDARRPGPVWRPDLCRHFRRRARLHGRQFKGCHRSSPSRRIGHGRLCGLSRALALTDERSSGVSISAIAPVPNDTYRNGQRRYCGGMNARTRPVPLECPLCLSTRVKIVAVGEDYQTVTLQCDGCLCESEIAYPQSLSVRSQAVAKTTARALPLRRAKPECSTLEELHEQTRHLYESITARAKQARIDNRRLKHRKRRLPAA